jgi:hypothetical protein
VQKGLQAPSLVAALWRLAAIPERQHYWCMHSGLGGQGAACSRRLGSFRSVGAEDHKGRFGSLRRAQHRAQWPEGAGAVYEAYAVEEKTLPAQRCRISAEVCRLKAAVEHLRKNCEAYIT